MKSKFLILIVLLFSMNFAFSQDVKDSSPRYIEVIGSAEKEVKPDIILFDICIQEYWKEEYETGKEYKDFVTKIPLQDIEKELQAELLKLGITKDQIAIVEGNNYSKSSSKNTMEMKTYQITVNDLKVINNIIQNVKTKGISYMRISETKSKDIAQYQKQVKIDALKDAKDKATYLAASLGNTLGQVLFIEEYDINNKANMTAEELHNLTTMSSNASDLNKNTIVLKYKIIVRFELK